MTTRSYTPDRRYDSTIQINIFDCIPRFEPRVSTESYEEWQNYCRRRHHERSRSEKQSVLWTKRIFGEENYAQFQKGAAPRKCKIDTVPSSTYGQTLINLNQVNFRVPWLLASVIARVARDYARAGLNLRLAQGKLQRQGKHARVETLPWAPIAARLREYTSAERTPRGLKSLLMRAFVDICNKQSRRLEQGGPLFETARSLIEWGPLDRRARLNELLHDAYKRAGLSVVFRGKNAIKADSYGNGLSLSVNTEEVIKARRQLGARFVRRPLQIGSYGTVPAPTIAASSRYPVLQARAWCAESRLCRILYLRSREDGQPELAWGFAASDMKTKAPVLLSLLEVAAELERVRKIKPFRSMPGEWLY